MELTKVPNGEWCLINTHAGAIRCQFYKGQTCTAYNQSIVASEKCASCKESK